MEKYKVKALDGKKDIVVTVPGSKSITNRALLMAALSRQTVVLDGVLFSDDSRYFLKALQELGFTVDIDQQEKKVKVVGMGGKLPKNNATIYVGSAGTAARFLTAMTGLSGGSYTIQASEQMKKRPMKPLFEALESLGVRFHYLEEPYFLPVQVMGRTATEGMQEVSLDISRTSQPLSALLMTSVMLEGGLKITVTSEKKNGSYIDITRRMMEVFGCVSKFSEGTYIVRKKSCYDGLSEYRIEPDVSAAGYFYALAAICGGSALVRNIHEDTMQGDIRFVRVLEQMGCKVEDTKEGIRVSAPDGPLKGIRVDMNNFSDQALTLAVTGIFADSPVTIENVGHIRFQECDRLHAIAENMKRLGVSVEENEDSITIYPGPTRPAEIETYEDHRVAMAFTLAGLKQGGVTILNPMCCKKTFENYFEIIDEISG